MSTKSRVNEIDLLRFLAALSVVFYHYTFRGYAADGLSVVPYPALAPYTKYGYLGVELFFMISGFVIFMTAASGGAKDFVVSRLVRLYPAFWVCCSITTIAAFAFGQSQFAVTVKQFLVNMTMFNNWLGVPPVDGVYWSLYVEMTFYAWVLGALLLGLIDRAQWLLVLWLLASLVLEVFPSYRLRQYIVADYSAYFIAGAACYLGWSRGFSWLLSGLIGASWCLAVFRSTVVLPDVERHYRVPINPYVVAAIVTAFFVIMLAVAMRRTGAIGQMRWMALGALTYPLYLIHQHVGFMIFNALYPAWSPLTLLVGTVSLALLLSYLVHTFFERRMAPIMKRALTRTTGR